MTYRRKSDREIEKIKQAQKREGLSPVTPLWLSLGSTFLIFLFVSHFPAKFGAPLGFSVKSLSVALASGLGIFIFLYVMQIITRRITLDERRAEICSVCFKANLDNRKRCPCGGEYEPRDFYEKSDSSSPAP